MPPIKSNKCIGSPKIGPPSNLQVSGDHDIHLVRVSLANGPHLISIHKCKIISQKCRKIHLKFKSININNVNHTLDCCSLF